MQEHDAAEVETVLCVPGNWASRVDVIQAIADKSDGYFFLGSNIMNTTTKQLFGLAVREHDPNLERAFSLASNGRLSKFDLTAISSHTFVLFAVCEGGSLAAAQTIIDLGAGLLRAGGLAIKVESSGIAHSVQQWLQYASPDSKDVSRLFNAYVTLVVDKNKQMYSCGMHNLGFRDAIVPLKSSPQEAANLLQTFLLYILTEKPTLKDNQTFSISASAPRYRLTSEPCKTYPADDLFYNPFGIWKLTQV